jgi:hypothetical protein
MPRPVALVLQHARRPRPSAPGSSVAACLTRSAEVVGRADLHASPPDSPGHPGADKRAKLQRASKALDIRDSHRYPGKTRQSDVLMYAGVRTRVPELPASSGNERHAGPPSMPNGHLTRHWDARAVASGQKGQARKGEARHLRAACAEDRSAPAASPKDALQVGADAPLGAQVWREFGARLRGPRANPADARQAPPVPTSTFTPGVGALATSPPCMI